MATIKLDRTAWRSGLDAMSKALAGKHVEIEVASLDIGSQVEAEWLPLLGIAYDEKSNLVEIDVEGLDRLIHCPREIYVQEDGVRLTSLEILDEQGFLSVLKFRDPLLLAG